MLCGFRNRGIVPKLIIFADTGAEMPHTYKHVEIMRAKVKGGKVCPVCEGRLTVELVTTTLVCSFQTK